MATPPEAVDRGTPRGAQVALIVALVVLVLALVWFFLLRGGEEPVDELTAPVATPTEVPTEAPTVAPGGQRKRPVETFEIFAPKDPFKPLVTEGAAAAEGGTQAGTGEQPGGGNGGGGNGNGAGGNGAGAPGPGGQPGGGGGDRVGDHRVRLVDVFTEKGRRRAQVQVDSTVYTVDEGERFAQNFKLLSISGECATMLFGDDQFTLCEGEEILK